MMNAGEVRASWQALAEEVGNALLTWRASHSRATLTEIEAVMHEALARLQVRWLPDLVHASAAADLAEAPQGTRACCPHCGEALQADGQQQREVLVPGQTSPLRLRRSHAVCPACGAGLFPPG